MRFSNPQHSLSLSDLFSYNHYEKEEKRRTRQSQMEEQVTKQESTRKHICLQSGMLSQFWTLPH